MAPGFADGSTIPRRETAFVGRHAQLALLRGELSTAFAGDHRVVVVEGDGGIGKTTLVDQVVGQLPEGIVIRASGDESESALTWGVVTQLTANLRRRGLRSATQVRPPLAGADPLAVGAGLVERVVQLTVQRPVAVVLDDLHWCDPTSATALLFALRRLDGRPVFTVVVSRPPFPGRLGAGWLRLITARGRRLRLGGLDHPEVVELAARLGRPVSPRAAERVRFHTGGHPMWAATLLQELSAVELEDGEGALPVPRDLAGAIRARHGALSRPARALVAAGAVLGARFSPVAAAALAGLDDPAPALQEGIGAELVSELPTGASIMFGFTHPLVRAAIYQDLGPVQRSRLHAEAVRLTAGREALAHLVAATLGPSETVAAELEAAGAAESASGELAMAQLHLDASVGLSRPGPHRRRRLLAAMEAHLCAGEPGRARSYAAEVEAVGPGPGRDYVLGCLARSEGRMGDAQALLLRAWQSLHTQAPTAGLPGLPTGTGELAAKIALELGVLALLRMSATEAVRYAHEAIDAAPRGSTVHLARCIQVIGLALGGAGAETLAVVGSAPAPGVELHELVGRGIAKLWTDDLLGAYDDLSVALARAQAGEPLRLVQPQAFLADTCYRLGRLGEAASHAEMACAIVDAAGRHWDRVLVHTRAGYAVAAMDDIPAAQAHAAAIAGLTGRVGEQHQALGALQASVAVASGVAAAVALARGDSAALLAAAGAVAALSGPSEPGAFALGPVLAEALVGVGRLDEAAQALACYEDRATALGRRSALAGAARVRGSLCAARGDHAGARCAFEAALTQARDLPLELGRCHHAFGQALAAGGDTRGARLQLAAARTIFVPAGARAYLRLVDATWAELEPAAMSNLADRLTPAERAVALLAVERMTNPEIAAKLVLSRKTVEYHLSHIYAKLGVHSRSELARLGADSPGRLAGSDGA